VIDMSGAEILIPVATAALIQGFQAWLAMARMAGLTEEQIRELMDTQYAAFKIRPARELPDA
jgi:hypothetical protein